jgi:predicted nuclease with TOPRIM domain
MREQMQSRLNELKQQFEIGQAELRQLQARENYLNETLLRLNGAMQVLEEMLALGEVTIQNNTDHQGLPVRDKTDILDAK